MIQLTPIAIAATSQQYLTNVVENLCQAYCADNGVQPTGIVNFTVAEQSTVNTQTTVTINAAVLVAYTPKGILQDGYQAMGRAIQGSFYRGRWRCSHDISYPSRHPSHARERQVL